jgi:hypothetical protein
MLFHVEKKSLRRNLADLPDADTICSLLVAGGAEVRASNPIVALLFQGQPCYRILIMAVDSHGVA